MAHKKRKEQKKKGKKFKRPSPKSIVKGITKAYS